MAITPNDKGGYIMKYKVIVPPTMQVGSYKTIANSSPMTTAREDALQDYNSARDHDGLPPLKRLPQGTQFIPIYA